jgi:hypothetical protein
VREPSIRYATARRRIRFASNRCASQSLSGTGHIAWSRRVIEMTDETDPM